MNKGKRIVHAAMAGDYISTKGMLDDDPSLVLSYNDDGWTPLHMAAYYGHMELAKLLLDYKADIFVPAKNNMAENLLHLEAANQEIITVNRMLHHAGIENLEIPEGWTPLHEAALTGNADILQLLLKTEAERRRNHRRLELWKPQ